MFEMVEDFRARLQALGKRQIVAGPQPEEAIAEIERLLNASLPPTYREFLKTYGAGFGVTGIWRGNPSSVNPGSLWGDTQRIRQQYKLSEQLIPVYFLPLGGACCLDLFRRDERGESPVVQVSVRPGSEVVQVEPHSATFGDFLIWHLEHLLAAYEGVCN